VRDILFLLILLQLGVLLVTGTSVICNHLLDKIVAFNNRLGIYFV